MNKINKIKPFMTFIELLLNDKPTKPKLSHGKRKPRGTKVEQSTLLSEPSFH